jgi:transposase
VHHKTVDTIVDKFLSVRASTGRYRRPNFPKDLKRRLAEQTFEPGASVALIARQNDINANLLFKWRQNYLDGDYGVPNAGIVHKMAQPQSPFFLPAAVIADSPATIEEAPSASPASAPSQDRRTGYCEVDFGHARLKVLGDISAAMLSTVIGELLRAGAARA